MSIAFYLFGQVILFLPRKHAKITIRDLMRRRRICHLRRKKLVVIGRSNLQNLYIHTVLLKKLPAEIYLIDDQAKTSVQDFDYASYYHADVTIHSGTFNECRNADIVVFFLRRNVQSNRFKRRQCRANQRKSEENDGNWFPRNCLSGNS